MKDFEQRISQLEEDVEKIRDRNRRVEKDKA